MTAEDDLRRRIGELEERLAALQRSVDELTRRAGLPAEPVQQAAQPPPVPPQYGPVLPTISEAQADQHVRDLPIEVDHFELEPQPALEPAPMPAHAVPAVETEQYEKPSVWSGLAGLEERIGGRWFNWVGILAIVCAAGYFLKYSFDQGWITPGMRFAMGLVAGAGLLLAGHVTRKSYPVLARGFWGGAIGMLFLVFFAGFRLLENPATGQPIIGQSVAFAGMAATMLLGAAISIANDTRAVASLSALAGYLTPALLSTGEPRLVFLFTYLAIVTTGFLVVGYWRRWRFLAAMGFAAIVFYFGASWRWCYSDHLGLTFTFLTIFFLLFSLEAVARERMHGESGPRYRSALTLANSLLYALGSLACLYELSSAMVGCYLVLLAGYHLGSALISGETVLHRTAVGRIYVHLAALFFLLSTALEERLTGHEVTIAWAIQGLALMVVGTRWGSGRVRYWAYAAFALTAFRLFAIDTPVRFQQLAAYRPLVNARGLTFAVVTATYSMAMRLRRGDREQGRVEKVLLTCLLILSVAAPVTYVSLEMQEAFVRFVQPHFVERGTIAAYAQHERHCMTLLWMLSATLVATIGRHRREAALTFMAILFAGLVLSKLALFDLAVGYAVVRSGLINVRFLTMLPQAACLFWLAYEFRRESSWRTTELVRAAWVLGHLLALGTLSFEVHDLFARHAEVWTNASRFSIINGSAFALAALWAAYGAALTGFGVVRRHTAARLLGLVAMSLAAVAVAGWSLASGVEHAQAILFNSRCLGAGIVGLAFLCCAELYRRRGRELVGPVTVARWQEQKAMPTFLCLAGHALFLLLLTLEANDAFGETTQMRRFLGGLNPLHARRMSFSIIWVVYAVGMALSGLVRRFRPLRLAATALLAVSIAKVFLLDLSFLQGLYRVLSLLTLGVVLVSVSFLYQRFQSLLMEESAQ